MSVSDKQIMKKAIIILNTTSFKLEIKIF